MTYETKQFARNLKRYVNAAGDGGKGRRVAGLGLAHRGVKKIRRLVLSLPVGSKRKTCSSAFSERKKTTERAV